MTGTGQGFFLNSPTQCAKPPPNPPPDFRIQLEAWSQLATCDSVGSLSSSRHRVSVQFLPNVKRHRTPGRGRGIDCGLRLNWPWRIELAKGQGFCAPVCCANWLQARAICSLGGLRRQCSTNPSYPTSSKRNLSLRAISRVAERNGARSVVCGPL